MHGLAGEVANPTAQTPSRAVGFRVGGQHNRTKKPRSAEERAGLSGTFKEGFAEMRVTAKPAAARTASARRHSELLQRISIFTLKMSATLKQFEDCAARCFEFARSATTTAGRARFLQMALGL